MYTLNVVFNIWICWEVSESVSNEWRLLAKSFDQP